MRKQLPGIKKLVYDRDIMTLANHYRTTSISILKIYLIPILTNKTIII